MFQYANARAIRRPKLDGSAEYFRMFRPVCDKRDVAKLARSFTQ